MTVFHRISKLLEFRHTPLRIVFSTLFSVFGNRMKHCLSFLIYYIISVQIRSEKLSKSFSRVGERGENWNTCATRTLPSIFAAVDSSVKSSAKDLLEGDVKVGVILTILKYINNNSIWCETHFLLDLYIFNSLEREKVTD